MAFEKEFYADDFKIGGDGGHGDVAVGVDKGMFKLGLNLGFPIMKAVQPVADFFKKLIPGEKYDKYVDDAIEAGLKALGVSMPVEAPTAAPEAAPAVAPGAVVHT